MKTETETRIPDHVIEEIRRVPRLAPLLSMPAFMKLLGALTAPSAADRQIHAVTEALILAEGFSAGVCEGAMRFALPDPQMTADALHFRLIKSFVLGQPLLVSPGSTASSAAPLSGPPPTDPT